MSEELCDPLKVCGFGLSNWERVVRIERGTALMEEAGLSQRPKCGFGCLSQTLYRERFAMRWPPVS